MGARKVTLRRLVRILAIAAVIAAVYLIGRTVDLDALGAALKSADPWLLAVAAVLGLSNLGFKALLWRVMLHESATVSTFRLFRYTVASFAASALTPARAGEALRIWFLKRRDHVPVSVSAGVALAEKLLDLLALLALVAPLPWLVPPLPPWTPRAVLLLGAIGLSLLGAGWIGARHLPNGRIATFVRQIRILHEPWTLVRALCAALGAWAVDFLMLWVTMRALGIEQGLAAAAFVLLAVNAALVVPATPGNVGAVETAAVLAVELLGVPRPQAVAFALLYHAIQLGPLLALALFDIRFVLSGIGPAAKDPDAAGGPDLLVVAVQDPPKPRKM